MCYNGNYNEKQSREVEQICKSCLSSDRFLQFENVKSESLVIADQNAAVNTFSGLVHTARHIMEVDHAQNLLANPQGRRQSTVGLMTGVKS
jgi:hypothetical protein